MQKTPRAPHNVGEVIDGFVYSKHPLYSTWNNMLNRCYCKSRPDYPRYGGRGIGVCRAWRSFATFVSDVKSKPHRNVSIERKNNKAWYSKRNCTWATTFEQTINQRQRKDNTSGATGVAKQSPRCWTVHVRRNNKTHWIGSFRTLELACEARKNFLKALRIDPVQAVQSLTPRAMRVRNNSSTGVLGVYQHAYGGYIVKCTIGGVGRYVGYFKTIKEGEHARRKFIENAARCA